jgi:hypothetical protein
MTTTPSRPGLSRGPALRSGAEAFDPFARIFTVPRRTGEPFDGFAHRAPARRVFY